MGPLYERIADAITRHIAGGALAVGERLPSVRRLSEQHKVSVSTAVQVYVTLEKRGLVDARPKSGFFVRAASRTLAPELRCSRPAARATKVSMGELRTRIFELSAEPDIVPLGTATPNAKLLPVAQLNRIMAAVVRQAGSKAIDYAPLTGCGSLRRQLARRSLEWGCQVAPDDLIVTNGATEALSLCLRATVKTGEIVALESPTYFGILQIVEALGLRALEVPTHPRSGMDLDRLEALLRSHPVSAVLAIPSFNNPLGSCMPAANRHRLVEMLARREVPLIEDDIYGDLAFPPIGRTRTAKGFDEKGWCCFAARCPRPSRLAGAWAGSRRDQGIMMRSNNSSLAARWQRPARRNSPWPNFCATAATTGISGCCVAPTRNRSLRWLRLSPKAFRRTREFHARRAALCCGSSCRRMWTRWNCSAAR